MAYNSPRPSAILDLAQRRQVLQIQSDATSPVGGGAPTDAATLQGRPLAYFAPAAHIHSQYAPIQYQSYTLGTEPAAGATWVGKTIMVTDASNPTRVMVCVINSAGGYEWLTVAQSS